MTSIARTTTIPRLLPPASPTMPAPRPQLPPDVRAVTLARVAPPAPVLVRPPATAVHSCGGRCLFPPAPAAPAVPLAGPVATLTPAPASPAVLKVAQEKQASAPPAPRDPRELLAFLRDNGGWLLLLVLAVIALATTRGRRDTW